MSLILDALRRAEAERVRGTVPGLHTQTVAELRPADGAAPRRSAGHGRWLLGGGALVLVAIGIGAAAWWLRDRPDGQAPAGSPAAGGQPPVASAGPAGGQAAPQRLPIDEAARPGLPSPSAPVSAAVPPLSTPVGALPADAGGAPLAPAGTSPVAPAPGRTETETWLGRKPAARPDGEQPRPPAAAAAPTPPALTPPAPASPAAVAPAVAAAPAAPPMAMPGGAAVPAGAATPVPWLADLPALRAQLPALTVSGGMYSDQPEHRLVIVNGQVLREGELVQPDLRLEQIRPRSVVFSHQGQRFALPM